MQIETNREIRKMGLIIFTLAVLSVAVVHSDAATAYTALGGSWLSLFRARGNCSLFATTK